jgi:hypothetical protein
MDFDHPSNRFGNGSRLKRKKKSVSIDANEKELRGTFDRNHAVVV